ncbi:helix-turn-helix domain-containing protein [Clostridium sp. ZS2-4]|uniref:helix-turn-helix domain-containing protein n=1 Tax=Clostridium sp. ZS2-4 TaxID=2987703 RepID=UPI00227D1843|nr:helix-turn-helix transcriptional regulator [Clostridium sp. ZS2-4]MCY6354881.1 helix-turn-helix transcriptional regulator [Clostridium sp. ZS2-4]
MKKARLKLGLSQYALATKTGLTRNSIDNYERDTVHPSRAALKKLITVIDKDYLCNDEYYKFILSDYPNTIKNWRLKNKLSLRAAAEILEIGAYDGSFNLILLLTNSHT